MNLGKGYLLVALWSDHYLFEYSAHPDDIFRVTMGNRCARLCGSLARKCKTRGFLYDVKKGRYTMSVWISAC